MGLIMIALVTVIAMYCNRESAATAVREKKMVVVIDPGHGGDDPGKVGVNGLKEKDMDFTFKRENLNYIVKEYK